MEILIVTQGEWGERIAAHLAATAPDSWQLSTWRGPATLPVVLDEPELYLPEALPQVDLLLVLTESRGMTDLSPDIAALCGARAAIVAIDRRAAAPAGLRRQVEERFEAMGVGCSLPMPFCSLAPSAHQHPLVRAFAGRYGRPEIACATKDGEIAACQVVRETPCGNTRYIAERLPGTAADEAAERAGLLHHYYPCWGGMGGDPVHGGHTLLHIAAKMAQQAVARSLKTQDAPVRNSGPRS
jgi:thymidylate synthase